MKKTLCTLAVIAMLFTTAASAQLKSGDFISICGDSITEQRIYSVMVEAYLLACSSVPDLEVTQFGWSGERIWGLNARYNNVIAPFGATVATTCYGMNDGSYSKISPALLNNYSNHLEAVVGKMKDAGVRFIVLGSPGIIDVAAIGETNGIMGRPVTPTDYNETLRSIGETTRQVAGRNGLGFADVHGAMVAAVAKARAARGADYAISKDGVHPFGNGQIIMAYAFLKGMGCGGEIGSINVDWAASTATSDSNQKVLGMKDGVIETESSRYPYYFESGKDGPREMVEYIPFNEELNRYMLVVKNAPAKANVTWGDASREYTAEELANGINLAADFPDNPFTPSFTNLLAAVRERQAFETIASKGVIETIPNWKAVLPDNDAEVESMRKAVMDKIAAKRKETRAVIKPVRHSIKIEAVGQK